MLLNFCLKKLKNKTALTGNLMNHKIFNSNIFANAFNNAFFNKSNMNFSTSKELNNQTTKDSKQVLNEKKSMKTDPHNFDIYGNIKPNFGKPPQPQNFPDYINKLPPVDPDQKYHYYDVPDSIKFAIKHNFPIIREPVSAYYTSHINGKTYHVFNAARVVSSKFYIIHYIFIN